MGETEVSTGQNALKTVGFDHFAPVVIPAVAADPMGYFLLPAVGAFVERGLAQLPVGTPFTGAGTRTFSFGIGHGSSFLGYQGLAVSGWSSAIIRPQASLILVFNSFEPFPWLNTPGTSRSFPTYQPSSIQKSSVKLLSMTYCPISRKGFNRRFHFASCRFHFASCRFHFASCRFHFASCRFHFASCRFHFASR